MVVNEENQINTWKIKKKHGKLSVPATGKGSDTIKPQEPMKPGAR